MTRQQSFKQLVRARMAETGERYTTARTAILAGPRPGRGGGAPPASPSRRADGRSSGAPVATTSPFAPLVISDEAVRERTGRGWEAWFDLLDGWGAAEMAHRDIARRVAAELAIDNLGWYAQAITISYERARKGRQLGQRTDGFSAGASKTVAADVDTVRRHFLDAGPRAAWLGEADLRPRPTRAATSMRFDWGDGPSRVHVTLSPKADGRTAVSVEHARLADAEDAAARTGFWRERLTALAARVAAAP